MTTDEKIELLCTVFGEGAKLANITAQTDVAASYYGTNRHDATLPKKPPFDPKTLLKTAHYQFIANFIYQNSVQNQQRRESEETPNFETKPFWAEHGNKWLLRKKIDDGSRYFFGKLESVKYDNSLFSTVENRFLTDDEKNTMLPYKKAARSIESTQLHQNVEKIVECRAINFDNIRSIRCGTLIEF